MTDFDDFLLKSFHMTYSYLCLISSTKKLEFECLKNHFLWFTTLELLYNHNQYSRTTKQKIGYFNIKEYKKPNFHGTF